MKHSFDEAFLLRRGELFSPVCRQRQAKKVSEKIKSNPRASILQKNELKVCISSIFYYHLGRSNVEISDI
jgi:hypothetical protein